MNDPRSFISALTRAWRSLTRRPGSFAIAVSSLAVALGLATAVIAEIDAFRHPYTPIRDPEHLYDVLLVGAGTTAAAPTVDELRALLVRTGLVERVMPMTGRNGATEAGAFIGTSQAEIMPPGTLEMMGIHARLGRLFRPDETSESGVILVSDEFWRRYYNNRTLDSTATLLFGGATYRIVGVLEPGHDVPFVLPMGAPPARARLVARLHPGATDTALKAALAAIAPALRQRYGASRRPFHFLAFSFVPSTYGLGFTQIALIASAVFILVIACANVSALMLARGVTRRRDQALQLALGAGRADLLRDLVAEVVILAFIGGAIGLLLASGATGALRALTPAADELRWQGFADPRWNPRVFAGMFGAVVAAVALAALAPAWYVSRIAPAEPLKDSSANTTGRPKKRFQLLVVAELALALTMLVGASLLARVVARVSSFDFGYAARSVYQVTSPLRVVGTKHVYAPTDTANQQHRGYVEIDANDLVSMVARLKAVPGVRDAAWVADDDPERDAISSDETEVADSIIYRARLFDVGPGFFATLGLPLVAGRDFVDGDRDSSGAAILDQVSARRLFPNGDALGRMVKLGPPLSKTAPWIRVVGIVRDAQHVLPTFPELAPPAVIYVSRTRPRFAPSFVVRAERGQDAIAHASVRAIRNALPVRTRVDGHSWVEGYESFLAARQFIGGIFSALGLASLLLATAGLFGVLAYVVNQRMREFAVRVALGATKPNVVRLVLRDSLVMALGGTAVGGLVALVGGGVFAGPWMWGMPSVDVIALVAAEVVLLGVTFAASLLPALRAARANPVDVMRAI